MTEPVCPYVVFLAYDENGDKGWIQLSFVTICTLLSLFIGIYIFITVIWKKGLYKTTLLLMYYIFTLMLLSIRLITFGIIIAHRISEA